MPRPVPTTLAKKAVIVPTPAPAHQPSAPPSVAPAHASILLMVPRLGHDPHVSHAPSVEGEPHPDPVTQWRAVGLASMRVCGSGEPVVSTIVRSTTVPFRRAIDESVVA